MKAISESTLQNSLDSGSTKRLKSYRGRLLRDGTNRIFDDKAVAELKRWMYDPKLLQSELDYLRTLSNDRGELFCRSIGHYSDMEAQFNNFLKPEKPSFRWNEHYRAAVATVKSRYSRAELKSLEYSSDEDIYRAVTDWSTATGWTSIVTGKSHKVDVLGGIYEHYVKVEADAKRLGSFGKPIICGTRTQGSGAYDEAGNHTNTWKSKKRAVFMVDVYVIVGESKFGEPLNQWLKLYPYSAIGKDDAYLTRWVSRVRQEGRPFISLDYSKYDSTIPSWLIHSAFDVIRAAFVDYDEQLLSVIEEDFINKNIVTGTGVIHVTHGNPSGSRLTAIINGICNEIMTETWLHAFNLHAMYNIMGDDNLIYLWNLTTDVDTLVSSVGQYIMHNFGVEVNSTKSNVGTYRDDPEYLSRYWSYDGPYRSVGEVISLLAYPERWRPYNRSDVHLEPWMIIYSYILAYRKTMNRIMDTQRFLFGSNANLAQLSWSKAQREAVPYNLRLVVELNGLYHKENRSAILAANSRVLR